jgi:hypothetical protein
MPADWAIAFFIALLHFRRDRAWRGSCVQLYLKEAGRKTDKGRALA